jgi:hypothetical protein
MSRNPGRSARAISQPGSVDLRKPVSAMSPEERRALRQQIHEAGHDLYRPKR